MVFNDCFATCYFTGPTTLYGDITVDNLTLTGLWNEKTLSDLEKDKSESFITAADTINVLETINQVPVSDFVFTGDDGVAMIKSGNVEQLMVTENIVVGGKVKYKGENLCCYIKKTLLTKNHLIS